MRDTELYLTILKCALNGVPFQAEEPVDPARLWEFSRMHTITATLAPTVLEAGVLTDAADIAIWSEALHKNIRKTMMFDVERENLYREFEKNAIWYAPLKGIIINHLFPEYGIREFMDNDILIDGEAVDKVLEVMESLGYRTSSHKTDIHYTFLKPPLMDFELHFRLFGKMGRYEAFFDYFDDIKSKLVPSGNGKYGYTMTDNDSYLFFMAHAYKHYSGAGTGFKMLADVYVCRNRMNYDREYVNAELKKLKILDFAETIESLAQKLFSGEGRVSFDVLNEKERFMLSQMVDDGTFGRYERIVEAQFKEYVVGSGNRSKAGYFKSRLFPNIEDYRNKYPFIYRHKLLRPAFYVVRPLKALKTKRKLVFSEMKTIAKLTGEDKE